ncbi:energy transducer TonB [Arboricoccus pini]|nr:TonB family protein [Arboricoccus pini]
MSPVTTPSPATAVQSQPIPAEPPPSKPVTRAPNDLALQKSRENRREPTKPIRQTRRPPPTSEAQPDHAPAPTNVPVGESGEGPRSESPTRGDPRAVASYEAKLSAWLSSNQHYPRLARMRRIEGTVVLYFRIDRQGNVADARIVSGSGSDLLDEEALAMLGRGRAPVPPADIPEAALAHQVPIRFMLR